MKAIFFIFLLFGFSSAFAIDSNVFDESYPSFKIYRKLVLDKLQTYFTDLPMNSLNFMDKNGTRVYKIRKNNGPDFVTIYSKITREISDHQTIERVSYFLENGKSLDYIIKKTGQGVTPSEDDDLLTFNFKESISDDFFQITLPTFKMELNHSLLKDGNKSTFYLGMMEVNIQMESYFAENEASSIYIYFFKGMPNPQTSLTVKAYKVPSEWNNIQFIHSSSNEGELTPKLFFQGLNQGTSLFVSSGEIIKFVMQGLGFPNFK